MIDESAAGLETFRHLGTPLQTFANVCMPHSVHKPLLADVQGDLATSIATPKYQTNPRRPGLAGLHVPLSSPSIATLKYQTNPTWPGVSGLQAPLGESHTKGGGIVRNGDK